MTIVDSGPGMGSSADDFRRHMHAISGGDRIVWGLSVSHYANLTVRIEPGQGVVDGIGFRQVDAQNFTSRPNPFGWSRMDRLVARVYPALIFDPTPGVNREVRAYKVEVVIKEGAVAEIPSLPDLQQNHDGPWEFGLAYWAVPGYSNGNIVDGKVWGHYADDGAQFSGDTTDPATNKDATIPTGTNALLLALDRPIYNQRQFAVPGAATVALDVILSCRADAPCAGVVTLQMAGRSLTATYKAMAAGIFTLTVPRFEAKIGRNGGHVPAIVQMSVEGEFGASTPLTVGRIEAHQYQVMP